MKKRLLTLVLAIVSVLCLGLSACSCNERPNGTYSFAPVEINGVSGYAVVSYGGSDENIVIPSTHDGKPVIALADGAFSKNLDQGSKKTGNKYIKSVTIPNTIIKIDTDAFYNCYALGTIIFEENSKLEEIGKSAFHGCTPMTSIKIPASVKTIGDRAFYYNWKLSSVVFEGNNLVSIGDEAFYKTDALTNITIPASVESIGASAFESYLPGEGKQGIGGLKNITFAQGSNLKSIGSYAFYKCTNLKSISIPQTVESIGDDVFTYCSSLSTYTDNGSNYLGNNDNKFMVLYKANKNATSFTFNPNTKFIHSSAFAKETNKTTPAIQQIVIPSQIQSIGSYAFKDCSNLNDLTIENGVERVGRNAFMNCSELSEITIPETVNQIGSMAFVGCQKLARLTVPFVGETYAYDATNDFEEITKAYLGFWFGATHAEKDATIATSLGNFETLPASLKEIEITVAKTLTQQTFINAVNLTTITLDSQTTYIGERAFSGCSALSEINGLSNVTAISANAFANCSALSSITLPNVSTISASCFAGCKELTSVSIPASVAKIDNKAFENCVKLQTVTLATDTLLESISDTAFNGCNSLNYIEKDNALYLGNGQTCLALIKAKSSDITTVTIEDSAVVFADKAFSNCYNLVSVNFNAGSELKAISSYAFENNYKLTSIVVPANVTEIGDFAFDNCHLLVEIQNLSSIEIELGDNDLKNGGIAYNAKNIYTAAEGASKLNNSNGFMVYDGKLLITTATTNKVLELPEVEEISQYAFYNDTNITSVTMPATIKIIGQKAFEGCNSLNNVVMNGVETIETNAFKDCYSLVNITIPESTTAINKGAFANCYKLIEVQNLSSLKITEYSESNGGVAEHAANVYEGNSGSKLTRDTSTGLVVYDGYMLVDYFGTNQNVTLPSTIYQINDYAFYNNETIRTITLNTSIIKLGVSAFMNCINLQSIVIPTDTQYIFENTFNGCINLTEVTLHDNITTIESSAFKNCAKLEEITLPNNSKFTTIAPSVFEGCASLKNVVIPETINTLGANAFKGCEGLEEITLSNKIQIINQSAFEGCSSLKEITLPSALVNINAKAFMDCTSLETVNFTMDDEGKYRIIKLDQSCFEGCSSLKSISIPKEVKDISVNALKGCSTLTEIDLENNTKYKTVTSGTFSDCSNVVTIRLPAVTKIDKNAFNGCDALTDLYVDLTKAEWNEITNGAFKSETFTVHCADGIIEPAK